MVESVADQEDHQRLIIFPKTYKYFEDFTQKILREYPFVSQNLYMQYLLSQYLKSMDKLLI